MELAYLSRMRGIEAVKLTNAHASDIGIRAQRVKGSNSNVVRWTPRLRNKGESCGVVAHADSLHGTLLLVHGMADDNVLFTHSTMLMQKLQSLDKPFDVMTYPGGKHGLVRMPQQGRHYYEMVLRFFEQELAEGNRPR